MNTAVVNCPASISRLPYDTACLQVHNDLEYPVDLFTVSSACVQCNTSYWTTVPLQATRALVVSAVHSVSLSAVSEHNEQQPVCQRTISFNQHEVVSWNVKECLFSVEQEGEDAFVPLYMFVGTLVGLLLLLAIGRALYHSRWMQNLLARDPLIIDMQNDLGNPSSSSDTLPLVQSELVPLRRISSTRIQALDTFRGMTIALMIFVNYGGGKYWFFEHAAWNGVTVADFVFPWFAWMMGVSLVISYRSKLRSCLSRRIVWRVSLVRSLLLLMLGLLTNMYNNNNLSTARFCGVLQRLAVAHFVVSTLEILFMKKQPSFQYGRWLHISELKDCWRQWLVILLLVILQVSITLYLPVPECPTGYLGPGGVGNYSSAPLCTGGAARYIDTLVFGDNHLYHSPPVRRLYNTTVPFDPEGLLGTLTTCLTVYLGVQAGYIILSYNSTRERVCHWVFWALITGVFAGFLCGWSQEEGLIPVNKQLWSLSFSLLTSAAGFLLLAILFVLIDHLHWWAGGPFRQAGMNAILLYIGHIITKKTFPWSWDPYNTSNHSELFAMNILGVLLWIEIATVLHNNEFFLTI